MLPAPAVGNHVVQGALQDPQHITSARCTGKEFATEFQQAKVLKKLLKNIEKLLKNTEIMP